MPFEDSVVCAYDVTRFGGEVAVEIMRTHPVIIVGGILQENPLFLPPAEFLREVHERRAQSARLVRET